MVVLSRVKVKLIPINLIRPASRNHGLSKTSRKTSLVIDAASLPCEVSNNELALTYFRYDFIIDLTYVILTIE